MTIDKARRKQLVARWHRRLALFISLWLVVLAASGFFINHAHEFSLDRKPIPSSMQQAIYGIDSGGGAFCGKVNDPAVECRELFAYIPGTNGGILLDPDNLYVVGLDGALIEKLGSGQFGLQGFEGGLGRDDAVYLRDANRIVRTDSDILDWQTLGEEESAAISGSDWQVSESPASSISWERLLLDVHAARFLGPLAKWFNDLMVVLILFIAISGIRLFSLKRNGGG